MCRIFLFERLHFARRYEQGGFPMNSDQRRSIRTHVGAALMLLFIAAVFLFFLQQSRPAIKVTESPEGGAIPVAVYFSEPGSPASRSLRGGPDAALADAIDAARYSVDMAVYRLDLWSIRDALIDAARRGVRVRLVLEGDNAHEPEVESIRQAGIEVVADQRAPLMHHKFVVIDLYEVWSGSMNFTLNGAYRNNNNLIRIQSRQLATAYVSEFEEMFSERRFGALSAPDLAPQEIDLDGGWVMVYFAPDYDVARALDPWLASARSEIDLLVFNFTSDTLAKRLIDRMQAGVHVAGVFESTQASNSGGEFDRLRSAGADMRLDRNPNDMHHKVIVIDGTLVITGSYNFSRAAQEENDENLLLIYSPDIAEQYLIEFSRLYEAAAP
jgi:phosphatidylserine/phosphatidylglycerophosphate/cardiolipin synthase-like enzyme